MIRKIANFSKICAFFLVIISQLEAWELKQLSESPRIFLVESFLTDEECDYIIEYARPSLQKSTVVDLRTGQSIPHPDRISNTMFCPTNHKDPVITNIENRIANLTSIPQSNGENLQVVQYSVGGKYSPHFDYFDNRTPGGALLCKRGGQRQATVILYLNTPEKGGETVFPKVNVTVNPEKGNAVLFYNTLPTGIVDPMTLHGGAPVLAGEKWIANRWLREKLFK